MACATHAFVLIFLGDSLRTCGLSSRGGTSQLLLFTNDWDSLLNRLTTPILLMPPIPCTTQASLPLVHPDRHRNRHTAHDTKMPWVGATLGTATAVKKAVLIFPSVSLTCIGFVRVLRSSGQEGTMTSTRTMARRAASTSPLRTANTLNRGQHTVGS